MASTAKCEGIYGKTLYDLCERCGKHTQIYGRLQQAHEQGSTSVNTATSNSSHVILVNEKFS